VLQERSVGPSAVGRGAHVIYAAADAVAVFKHHPGRRHVTFAEQQNRCDQGAAATALAGALGQADLWWQMLGAPPPAATTSATVVVGQQRRPVGTSGRSVRGKQGRAVPARRRRPRPRGLSAPAAVALAGGLGEGTERAGAGGV